MAEILDFPALWPHPLTRYGLKDRRGACAVQVASYLAHGTFCDTRGQSEVISELVVSIQDATDRERQALKRIIPLLVGSADKPNVERARARYLATFAIGVALPMALDAAGSFKAMDEADFDLADMISALLASRATFLVHEKLPFAPGRAAHPRYSPRSRMRICGQDSLLFVQSMVQ